MATADGERCRPVYLASRFRFITKNREGSLGEVEHRGELIIGHRARALHEANFKPIEGASVLGHSLATHLQHYLPTGDEYVRGAEERMRALFADAS
ncbi:hypothetical protein GCM10028864_01290 [Microlunatus parietis]